MTELLGRWKLIRADAALGLDPDAVSEFKAGGELLYTVRDSNGTSVMRLVYRVDGKALVTDQPSSPREERTNFRVVGDLLELQYDGGSATFERVRSDIRNGAR